MRILTKYIKPHILQIIVGFTIKFTGTIMDLFLPWILAYIIDTVIPQKDTVKIVVWGVIMVICSIFAVLFNIIANRMASRVAGNCTRDIRHDLYAKISYLDSSKIDEFTISSLESRLTSDTYYVHQMLGMIQRLGVRAPILLIGGITVTFMLDARLSLVMLCTMPFIAFSIYYFSKKGIPLYTKLQQSIDKMTAVVRDNASGIRIIKALRKSEYEKERFDKVNIEAIENEKKAGATMAATNPLITFFLNAGLAAVIVVGAHLVYSGKSGVGNIIAFMSYFTIISNAMLSVSRMFTSISKGSAGMNRIEKVITSKSELFVEDLKANETPTTNGEKGENYHVEFKNVSFSYGKTRVLSNISFAIRHSQTLGIIGATGSGKSTIISLLMRTYDAEEGEIYLDGRNIKEIPTKKLCEKFGVVFQNDFLFADSIKENVSFCRDLDDKEIEAALENAQALDFVNRYEDKTMHMLDIKGANISGGQKQRLLIARALAGNPEFLVLDDSSSALDYKTDARLRKVIAEKFSNVTKIIVAQRISSIMHSDLIIMLDEGRIIGSGTHAELLNSCEKYRETYTSQMGGDLLA